MTNNTPEIEPIEAYSNHFGGHLGFEVMDGSYHQNDITFEFLDLKNVENDILHKTVVQMPDLRII